MAPAPPPNVQLVRPAPASLQIVGLTKFYGEQRVLANICFDIRPREILGLIGPNERARRRCSRRLQAFSRPSLVRCFGMAGRCHKRIAATRYSTSPMGCDPGRISSSFMCSTSLRQCTVTEGSEWLTLSELSACPRF
jgi:hypothetical protein